VVTGASRGIGAAIASALAAAGADVASLNLPGDPFADESEAAIRAHGHEVLFVEGSTADVDAVEAFAARVLEDWGGIDVWVNNAAGVLMRPLLETDPEAYRTLLSTNLDGYWHGARAAARRMTRGGRIVNVSSVVAQQPVAGLSAYTVAKGGAIGLTRAAALELAPLGITVNAVAPGAIVTPAVAGAYGPELTAAYEARIALGRLGRPEDVTGAVVFLASDAAAYITGQNLVVDGGMALNGNPIFVAGPPPAG
jgi:NAD(P)-dependent dehydrogenase (short-subunit alcohol dehydrogenase family)